MSLQHCATSERNCDPWEHLPRPPRLSGLAELTSGGLLARVNSLHIVEVFDCSGQNGTQAILRVSAASAEYHTAAGVLFANETCSLSGSDYMLKRWEAFTRFNVEAPFRAKFLGTPLSLTMCRMTVAPKCRYRRARAKVKLERCTTISAGLAACGAVREAKSQVKPAAVKTAALHVKFVSLADL